MTFSSFAVIVYNSLPRPRSVEVRLPIGNETRDVSITDPQNNQISSSVTKIDGDVSRIYEKTSLGEVEMAFLAKDVPALGTPIYTYDKLVLYFITNAN